jgi:glucosyl-3-phosphoglycerate synthase
MQPAVSSEEPGQQGRPPARHHHGEFPLEALLAEKAARGATVQVVIPARDEATTIGPIVSAVRRGLMEGSGLVDALVVVDDASSDETAAVARRSGAQVVAGPGEGKGEAMARALSLFAPEPESLVVFLDGDVTDFEPHFVTGLLGPLLCSEQVELVKGCYDRPLGPSGSGGGRVTELVAKPALSLYFPDLCGLAQPLSGETALRASLAKETGLAGGYAVEVALLIDTYLLAGTSAIAEVDLGVRHHRNRRLAELVPQASEVLAAVLERAGALRREGGGAR